VVVGIVFRAGPDESDLRHEHVREMDFTGRPMKAMIFVEPAGLAGRAFDEWVASAAAFVHTLGPKPG